MIEFHAGTGPDTQAIGIALEEMFFDYQLMPGKAPLPVIALGGARVVGAANAVMALARKTGRFLPPPEEAAPWLPNPPTLDALEAQLTGRDFLLGPYSVADMAAYPHAARMDASKHASVSRWLRLMRLRSGVGRGMSVVAR